MVMEKNAYYMLRKDILLWEPQEAIREGLDFSRVNSIDEIIWMTDAEEFSHGLPPLDLIKEYLPHLNYAREVLNKNSIKSSIQPFVVMNHADRGRNAAIYHPDMRMFVNGNGTKHTCRPCPMDTVWQKWLIDAYTLYASTKPEILWVDDDFTNSAKECRGNNVPEYGCFCDVHIEEISRISRVKWNREDLVNAIKQPGRPHPVRKQWFELHSDTMIKLGEGLEKAVHNISKDTKLGLMCSWSNDGRWWDEFLKKISGPYQPVARPGLSIYTEEHPRFHLFDIRDHRKECKCLPEDSRICPELENFPYTAYSKSARFTKLELGLSQLLGYPDITLNMFARLGTPMAEEERYCGLLGDIKPKLNGIASRGGFKGEEKGVGVLFRKRASDYMHLKESQTSMDLHASAGGDGWGAVLQASGIPVQWEDSEIMAISGQALRACSEDEIKKFLSRSMLIDGCALEILCEMGFESYTGCKFEKWISRYDKLFSVEELVTEPSKSEYAKYMTLFHVSNIADVTLDEKVKVVSYIVDNDRKRIMPGMTCFENDLGGRIAVYPSDLSDTINAGFLNWHRKEQIYQVIKWLGRGKIDLFVEAGAWMIPIRRDYPDYIFIGLVNLETDNWNNISLTLNTERQIKHIKRVQDDGSWKKCNAGFTKLEDSNVKIDVNEGIGYMDFTAFIVELK